MNPPPITDEEFDFIDKAIIRMPMTIWGKLLASFIVGFVMGYLAL